MRGKNDLYSRNPTADTYGPESISFFNLKPGHQYRKEQNLPISRFLLRKYKELETKLFMSIMYAKLTLQNVCFSLEKTVLVGLFHQQQSHEN